jgi:hypothetical protein
MPGERKQRCAHYDDAERRCGSSLRAESEDHVAQILARLALRGVETGR